MLGNKWIIDVLADLTTFAQSNGLELLANQLEQTAQVATAEIATVSDGALRAEYYDENQTGHLSSRTG